MELKTAIEMTVERVNTEIRDLTPDLMVAEGTSDVEPKAEDIKLLLLSEKWECSNINIRFDNMQGFWRWNCDIARPS